MYHKTEEQIISNWERDKSNPAVSICCITYNHKNFVSQAIDSFLMQRTDFPFEVLIHDDASNDGTKEILKEYANRYPNIIKIFTQDENQYSQGVRFINARFLLPHAKGQYIALCEGDDYWVSTEKLSTQYKFMEENLKYSFCFHAAFQRDDTLHRKTALTYYPIKGNTFYFEDILKKHFIPTVSLFFRKKLMPVNISSYKLKINSGDIFMELLLASKGPAHYIEEVMGVYRHHDGGVTKKIDYPEIIESNQKLFKEIDSITQHVYSELIEKRASYLEMYCYLRYFFSKRDIKKSIYYISKIIITHPRMIAHYFKDKMMLKVKSQ